MKRSKRKPAAHVKNALYRTRNAWAIEKEKALINITMPCNAYFQEGKRTRNCPPVPGGGVPDYSETCCSCDIDAHASK